MKLTPQDSHDITTLMRGKKLTVDDVAELLSLHRTTITKKLTGAQEITALDLWEMAWDAACAYQTRKAA